MKTFPFFCLTLCLLLFVQPTEACTGISLRAADGSPVIARTIEWAGSDLNSRYVIVPRGYRQRSYTPSGQSDNEQAGTHTTGRYVPPVHPDGMRFTAKYGYVGLAVERDEFVVDGINEAGFAAGLFYFPHYGEYVPFDSTLVDESLSDMQVVSWLLSRCASVDEAVGALQRLHIIATDPRGSTVHWRIADRTGKQVVVEVIAQQIRFYENTLGVLTNSPSFDWHLTNLNNYINLRTGAIPRAEVGELSLQAFGGGGGLHGLPGDMTPPSRFVRAAFFQATAPTLPTATETIMQAFHILNNFDIPIGIQFAEGEMVPDIPSATQWTTATDLQGGRIYYRTMYNSRIRCLDLHHIDFRKVKFHSAPLDEIRAEQIEMVVA